MNRNEETTADQSDLDELLDDGCGNPDYDGCASPEAYVRPPCHPGAPVLARYREGGMLDLICSECRVRAITVRVAMPEVH